MSLAQHRIDLRFVPITKSRWRVPDRKWKPLFPEPGFGSPAENRQATNPCLAANGSNSVSFVWRATSGTHKAKAKDCPNNDPAREARVLWKEFPHFEENPQFDVSRDRFKRLQGVGSRSFDSMSVYCLAPMTSSVSHSIDIDMYGTPKRAWRYRL